jgi:hypothetical protein
MVKMVRMAALKTVLILKAGTWMYNAGSVVK